jgi:hypothetical protein
MSVYEVSAGHIGYLVSLGHHLGVSLVLYDGELKQLNLNPLADRAALATTLIQANRRSVHGDHRSATIHDGFTAAAPPQPVRLFTASELCQALQWVTCYRYQCAEWDEWTGSFADAYTARLHTELVTRLIALHKSKWEYQ